MQPSMWGNESVLVTSSVVLRQVKQRICCMLTSVMIRKGANDPLRFSRFGRTCCSCDSETKAPMMVRFAFVSGAQMSHYDR